MRLALVPLLIVLSFSPANGHDASAPSEVIALDEKLGETIPGDIVLRDENGRAVNLRTLIDRPTIIAPVYLHCSHTCPLMLTGLATVLGKIELVEPGKDFRVIALSFDENETPAVAREKKPNFLASVKRPLPADAWPFLTGDAANIRKFTDSVGYRFQRAGEDFNHPVAVIVLAPGGKVVRYLQGVTFLPFQITMAVTEAAEGRIGSPTGRLLTYCFSYDPKKQGYSFNVLKVVGTVMLLTILAFFIFLMVTGKKKSTHKENS